MQEDGGSKMREDNGGVVMTHLAGDGEEERTIDECNAWGEDDDNIRKELHRRQREGAGSDGRT